ncbi:polysaccharide deacetylase family protein [Pedobacter gandavensis]|uniref:Polysaccharide deacetylase n=1 Tax=Pedobacter gandavensis TaxID=2679963 RepID=A0ABR6F1X4_9SPHI|nr:polysaccharide deacetylase [Pedobacter gandavensis]MBB2150673.1 polysaccharide deacetylase [Pedobacter gandavensis]
MIKLHTILTLVFCSLFAKAQKEIQHYKAYFATGSYNGKNILVLRQFEQEAQQSYLIVNPQTLETQIINSKQVSVKPIRFQEFGTYLKNTPYFSALQTAQQQSLLLQDAGITHGFPKEKGITLTIDLCPSHKPLDRTIFSSLIAAFQKHERPVPVALSITGKFMLNHSDDINWLLGLQKSGDLNITWTNHTFNHHYNPKAPLAINFLMEPGTDLNFEILGLEKAMIERGLLPSVFFRFPGLVSDQKLVDQVTSYGLIPIGSDAWLAKGQQSHAGSLVLIHGNGNEPIGVKDFIKLLVTEKATINQQQWLLYDLRTSIENEFR